MRTKCLIKCRRGRLCFFSLPWWHGRGREESGYVFLLLAEASFEERFEDLHDGDESFHVFQATAELRLTSPGSRQPRLRLGKAAAQICDRHRVVVPRSDGALWGRVVSGEGRLLTVTHDLIDDWRFGRCFAAKGEGEEWRFLFSFANYILQYRIWAEF